MDGVKIKLSPSFYALAGLMIVLRQSYLFLLYVFSVLIHESAHYFVAKKFGFKCQTINLTAFGAVLYGKFDLMPVKEQAYVAIAGPLSNIIVALLCIAVWWIVPESYTFTQNFVLSNLSIGFLNLIPCYPLDGGRLLAGVLRRKMDEDKTFTVLQNISFVFSIVFFFLFCLSMFVSINVTLGLFSIFLLMSSLTTERKNIYMHIDCFKKFDKRLKIGLEKKCYYFIHSATLHDALKKMSHGLPFDVEIVDENINPIGFLEYARLNECIKQLPLKTLLIDACSINLETKN